MNFGIIVASRNRPIRLVKAIESVAVSEIVPTQIVIVTSGDDVSSEIEKLSELFDEITHFHSQKSGQINQKKEAIKLLKPQIEYVLFLDDDVAIEAETASKLLHVLTDDVNCVGVGVKLKIKNELCDPKTRVSEYVKQKQFMVAGVPRSYQDMRSVTEVAWLNGISMWKREVVDRYDNNFPNMPYAAFEDVYFSQIARRFGNMFFVPDAIVRYQDVDDENLAEIQKLFKLRIFANANVVLSFNMPWLTFLTLGYLQYLALSLKMKNLIFRRKIRLALSVSACFLALASYKVNSQRMISALEVVLENKKDSSR